MAAWIDARWFWTLLILTLCGEFLLPCLLARKDPAYRPGTMAVSVLGRRGGPVARVYRLWLAWLGIWLLTTAAVYAVGAAPASRWLAAGLAVSLGGFALGAGILAALFPTGLTKDLSDRSALIHGIASAPLAGAAGAGDRLPGYGVGLLCRPGAGAGILHAVCPLGQRPLPGHGCGP